MFLVLYDYFSTEVQHLMDVIIEVFINYRGSSFTLAVLQCALMEKSSDSISLESMGLFVSGP